MSMDFIRNKYDLDVKRGDRVLYSGGIGEPKMGSITGTAGAYLRIRLDGETRTGRYHPTWMLVVLPRAGVEVAV